MGIFENFIKRRVLTAQQKEDNLPDYVNRSYADIFGDYKEYSNKALKDASIMQAVSSSGQYLASSNLINKMDITRTPNISTGSVSLSSYNMATPATNKLDQSFNSMLRYSRESGRAINPLLLSSYSDAATEIHSKQAEINNEIKNKEEVINSQLSEDAKKFNATNLFKYHEAKDKLGIYKTGMKLNNLNQFAVGISNISNIKMAKEANDLSAELGIKALQTQERLESERLLGEQTGFDKTNQPPKYEIPEIKFNKSVTGFDVNKIDETRDKLAKKPTLKGLFSNKITDDEYFEENDIINDLNVTVKNYIKPLPETNTLPEKFVKDKGIGPTSTMDKEKSVGNIKVGKAKLKKVTPVPKEKAKSITTVTKTNKSKIDKLKMKDVSFKKETNYIPQIFGKDSSMVDIPPPKDVPEVASQKKTDDNPFASSKTNYSPAQLNLLGIIRSGLIKDGYSEEQADAAMKPYFERLAKQLEKRNAKKK